MWPPLPDYGCFARWPRDGQSWIHPEDVAIVTRVIPSDRIFKRVSFDQTYDHYRYGKIRFRLRPAMWSKIEFEGFDIGDAVETIGRGLERELFIGEISGMYFLKRKGQVAYRLRHNSNTVPGLFLANQMRLLKDKSRIQGGNVKHPMPKWNGQGERISGLD
jgi:hypothetical protein